MATHGRPFGDVFRPRPGKTIREADDRGIVAVETKALNQRGEEVCYFRRKLMVWKRDHPPTRRRPYYDNVWD